MNETVIFIKKNESTFIIRASDSIKKSLCEFFSYKVDNFNFKLRKYKNWDGVMKLISYRTGEFSVGLLKYVVDYLLDNNLCKPEDIKYYDNENYTPIKLDTNYTISDLEVFLNEIELPFELRDYQKNAILECLNNRCKLIVSPTSSGKTAIMYVLTRIYNILGEKVVIIMPNITLVNQTQTEFIKYGCDDRIIYTISGGIDKTFGYPITICTWQSIYKLSDKHFSYYNCVLVDECHLAQGKSLSTILKKSTRAKYRYGFTGTLQDSKVPVEILKSLFGEIYKVITTKQLIENKQATNVNINIILINHKPVKFSSYMSELLYIVENEQRNDFICKLLTKLQGNSLALFSLVKKHGLILQDMIRSYTDKPVYMFYGNTSPEDREIIRHKIEEEQDAIILATYQTFQQGVNVPSIKNLVYTSPFKSNIRNLQSIGRILRLYTSKNCANVYDIADNFHLEPNYTKKHLHERIGHYKKEEFPYKISQLNF